MKKIPCLFVRIFNGRSSATISEEVTLGCEWVLAGEGVGSRKWDGTAAMVRGGVLYKRLDCKRGKVPPVGAIPCQEPDAVTGHWPHWILVNHEAKEDRWFTEAWSNVAANDERLEDGTYELIGERINGNPQRVIGHYFERHGADLCEVTRSFDGIREYLAAAPIEGIVFAHADGRMCKIRRDDFGLSWPVIS